MTRREEDRNCTRKVCQERKDWAQEDESRDPGGLKTRSSRSSFIRTLLRAAKIQEETKPVNTIMDSESRPPVSPDGRTCSSWMTMAHRSFNNQYFCLLISKQRSQQALPLSLERRFSGSVLENRSSGNWQYGRHWVMTRTSKQVKHEIESQQEFSVVSITPRPLEL